MPPARRRGINKKVLTDFWMLPGGFVIITILLLLARQSTILELFYPVGAILVGIFFLRRFPVHYVSFSWWLWFFTPEVRRLADFFHGGFNPVSPIQVAPVAVAMMSFFPVAKRYRFLGTKAGLPYLLMLVGTFYAYIVGILNYGAAAASFSYASWAYTILIGLYMATTVDRYPEYRDVLMRTFLIGGILLGIYGLIQYMIMPPWDALWLVLSGLTSSMGQPVPFGSRLFGSLNSTGTFSGIILVPILLSIVPNYRWRVIAAGLGTICLGLTMVRSAWGGLIIGLAFLMTIVDARTKLRIIFGGLILAVLVVPVFMIPTINEAFVTRLNTVNNLSDDGSYEARSAFYATFLSESLENIGGVGMGGLGTSARLDDNGGRQQLAVAFDSGIMEIPYTLGWPGGLLYLIGVFTVGMSALRNMLQSVKDRFVVAFFAVSLCTLAQIVFVNTLTSSSGILFMMGVTIPYMAVTYRRRYGNLPDGGRR